jgi:predicted metal-dependent HD superfamily phosphohydrolase
VIRTRRGVSACEELFRQVPLSAGTLLALRRRLRAPNRHYHGLEHLSDLWLLHRRLAPRGPLRRGQAQRLIACATVFHDAVLDPRSTDNEAKSALLWLRCARLAGRLPRTDIRRVADVIEATALHSASRACVVADDKVTRWFIDLDLGAMGACSQRFRRNTAWLRTEAAVVPTAEWERQRLAFLGAVSKRPQIFCTRPIGRVMEAAARANIARELREAEPAPARYGRTNAPRPGPRRRRETDDTTVVTEAPA